MYLGTALGSNNPTAMSIVSNRLRTSARLGGFPLDMLCSQYLAMDPALINTNCELPSAVTLHRNGSNSPTAMDLADVLRDGTRMLIQIHQ